MLISRAGSIKGCGNAKVVKTLVAMTTALHLSRSGIQIRALAVTACLRAGLELPAVRSGFSQATCFVTLGRKSPSLCFSFLAVGTAPPQPFSALNVTQPFSASQKPPH